MTIIQTINEKYLFWLFNMPYFWTILIVSVVVTLITTIIYKYATDQKELKRVKEQMKKYQDEVKKYRDNPKKAMEIQKKMFALSGEQMKHSLSAMLYTFLPVILIFAWMNASIAYEPITPNAPFNVTIYAESVSLSVPTAPNLKIISNGSLILGNQIISTYTLLADKEGSYTIFLEKSKDGIVDKQSFDILVTNTKEYTGPIFLFKNSVMNKAVVSNKGVKPFGTSFNIFGWYPGWLAAYILLTIILSSALRKVLDVY